MVTLYGGVTPGESGPHPVDMAVIRHAKGCGRTLLLYDTEPRDPTERDSRVKRSPWGAGSKA